MNIVNLFVLLVCLTVPLVETWAHILKEMCDLSLFAQVIRMSVGLPMSGGGSKTSSIMQATSARNSVAPLTPAEVSEEISNLTVSTDHFKRKAEECMSQIAIIVEGGRSPDSVHNVVRLVKEKRQLQVRIRNNCTRLANLEGIHGALAESASNAAYASIMNRAGTQLMKQNPDEAVDRVEESMARLKDGMDNHSKVSDALNAEVQGSSVNDDDMSIEEEVKKLFDDAEKRKLSAMLFSATPVPTSVVPAYMPPAAAAVSAPTSIPQRSTILSHTGVPLPPMAKQAPQNYAGPPSVPRPKNMSAFTNV